MSSRPVLQPLALAGAVFSGGLLAASLCGYAVLAGLCLTAGALCAGTAAWTLLRRPVSRRTAVVLLGIAAALTAAFLDRCALIRRAAQWAGETVSFSGKIETVSQSSRTGYLIRAEEGLSPGTRVLVYSGTAPEFSAGERVALTAEINAAPPTRNQLGKGADLICYAPPETISLVRGASGPSAWMNAWREALRRRLYRNLSADAASFYEAVLLGDSDALSDRVREGFSATGTAHLLCISGLHVSMLMAGVQWVFRRILGAGKAAFLLTLLTGGAYVIFTGAAPSSVRAWIMAAFSLAAGAFVQDYSPGNALGGAVLLLCLWNPRVVCRSGFWLSVLASAALFAVAPRWTAAVSARIPRRVQRLPEVKGGVRLLCGTLSANLCCLPVFLLWSGSVPVLAPLANLVLVPLFPFLMLGGALCLLGGWAAPLGSALNGLLRRIFAALEGLAQVPHGSLPLGQPWLWLWAGTTLLLFAAGALCHKKRLAAALSALLLTAGAWTGALASHNVLTVAEIATDSGGSVVLTMGGRAVVIGCGGDSLIGGKTAAYLKSIGVSALDAVIVPRESRRSMGGVADLSRQFPVEALLSDDQSNWYQTAWESSRVRELLPFCAGDYRLFGRFPLHVARAGEYARIGICANGRRLLFLSEGDPAAAALSTGADLVYFYEEIPQKDGNSAPGYAIIKDRQSGTDKQSWLDGFSEIGNRYDPARTRFLLPGGRVRSREG